MRRSDCRSYAVTAVASLCLFAACAAVHSPARTTSPSLAGTAWQLVKIQGSDGTTLTPDDKAKYTIAFKADGSLAARLDCNRGRGAWKSPGPGQLHMGPMVLTRAMCPPGSLQDRIVKDWGSFRSYAVKDGRLYLSMADGGVYELEPIPGA